MKNVSDIFHSHLESMHALPEHVRKMFMVVTMIFAATFVGLVSWLLFPPLQDIGLPSLNTNQQITNNYQAMDDLKEVVKNNEFANMVKIPEIGPASGFMQSFKAVSDLIVPQNLQNPLTQGDASALRRPSWLTSLSRASAGVAFKLRGASLLALEDANKLKNSYLARVPSYASYVLDLLISSASRTAM